MKALLKSLLLTAVLIMSAQAAHHENPKVLIKTTMGDITVSLNADKAPLSVLTFLSMSIAVFTTAQFSIA